MRVALFTETFLPHTDGIVTRLIHTIKHLRVAGDDVLVLAPARPGLPHAYEGARVVGLPSAPLPVYPDFRVGLPIPTRSTRLALQAFRPDLLHVINPTVLGIGGIVYARKEGIRLVASFHTNLPDYARRYHVAFAEGFIWWYLRTLHNVADLNLCTSKPVLAQLRAHNLQRVELWEPGVDAPRFARATRSDGMRARLLGGDTSAQTLLLYVGRLAPEKELHRLAPVLRSMRGCHLAIVGAGPARRWLERVFEGLPVTFVGTLHGDALASAYASADLFVIPSSTETLGLVAAEAMSAGLPVVGARRGGIPDLVADGKTGLLFDPDIPGDLLAKVNALVGSTEERASMSVAARERAKAWSWSATTAGLRARYHSVVGKPLPAAEPEPEAEVAG